MLLQFHCASSVLEEAMIFAKVRVKMTVIKTVVIVVVRRPERTRYSVLVSSVLEILKVKYLGILNNCWVFQHSSIHWRVSLLRFVL